MNIVQKRIEGELIIVMSESNSKELWLQLNLK